MFVLLWIVFFLCFFCLFFFFNDTATTEIYTLSLHDALPISPPGSPQPWPAGTCPRSARSEEHTSELQSRLHLVCRLLLEKKKKTQIKNIVTQKKKNKPQNKKTWVQE